MKEIKKVNKSKRKISDEGNRKKKNQNIYINSTNNNKQFYPGMEKVKKFT